MARKIGKYELQKEIGRGGFGSVHRAFDPTVNRIVAIKVLTASDDPTVLSRFRLEATSAGNLHHKNIITIYDFGQHEGLPYLVMEYLEGEDLQKTMAKKRPLSLIDKMQIMTQVADGLNCAHQHGVIHRDIKPANIMVLPDSSVKLMDFGIARMTDPDASRQTKTGFFVGTLLYISPEQLAGGDATIAADIWAYGVILYELLTGVHPFSAPDMATVMYKIMHVDPAPLPTLVPECPEGLAGVVQRALSKDPDLRYQSLEDLKFDLEPVLLDLQKQHAETMVREAEALFQDQHWNEAQSVIRKVLDLDPSNRQGRQLREALQKKVHIGPRIEALIKCGDEEYEKRNFEAALRAYESAVRLDQSDTQARARLSQAQEALEQSKKALNLLKEARAEFQLQNFTAAHRHASEAVQTDPNEPQAVALLKTVQTEIERRDRERILEAGLSKARGLLLLDSYDEAIGILTKLEESAPEAAVVSQLLNLARREKQEWEKREKLGREIENAKSLVKNGRFSQAVTLLKPLTVQWPNHTELGRLCTYAEEQVAFETRKQAVEGVHRRAQTLLDAEQFDEAIRTLDQALQTYPGEGLLQQLLESAWAGKRTHERELKVLQHKTRCEELERQGRTAEALQYLERLGREYVDDPVLLNVKARLQKQWEQQQRAEAIRTVMARAQTLIAASEWAKAIELLEYGCVQYPESQELQTARVKTIRQRQENEREQFVNAELARAKEFEQRRDFKSALAALTAALTKFPNDLNLIAALDRARSAAQAVEIDNEIAKERARIEQLIASGRLDMAGPAIEDAKKRFPNTSAFRELHSRLQDAFKAEAKKATVAQRAQEIQKAIQSGDLPAALRLLENAQLEFPGEASLRPLETQVRKQLEEIRNREYKQDIDRRVQQIEQALAAKNYVGALRLSAAAELVYPGEKIFPKMSSDAKRGEEQSQMEQVRLEIARRKSVIEQAIGDGEFAQAANWITAAQAAYPAEAVFQQLLDALKRKQAEARDQEVKRDVTRRKTAISDAIGRAAFEDAFALISAAQKAHPGEVAFSSLHAEATRAQEAARAEQRRRDVVRATEDIQKALGQNDLTRAAELISSARRQFPEQTVFNSLLDDLNARVKRKHVEDSVAAIHAALGAKDFPKAAGLVDRSMALYPKEESLRALSETVERARKHQECLAEAERELKKARFNPAEKAAREALKYAADTGVANELIGRIETARFNAEEQQQLRLVQSEVEKLNRGKAFDLAVERAQEGLTRFPNDPFLQEQLKLAQAGSQKLMEARQVERTKTVEESPEQTRLFQPPAPAKPTPAKPEPTKGVPVDAGKTVGKKPWLRWLAVAGVVVALLGGGLYLIRPRPRPLQKELSTSVPSLTFAYQAGAAPASQTLDLSSNTPIHLTAAGDQKWLRVSPEQGVSPVTLQVTVDSAQLTAGDYQGKILINPPEDPDLARTVAVRVTVTPAPPPPPAGGPKPTGTIVVSTQRVTFDYTKGAPAMPASQQVTIQSSDKGPIPFRAGHDNRGTWLTASPGQGTTPARVNLSVDPRGLKGGEYVGALMILPVADPANGRRVEVRLVVREAVVVVAPPPPPPPPAKKEPEEPPKAKFVPRTYHGASRGNISWTGVLPPSGRLVFGPAGLVEGPGGFHGDPFPGDRVRIVVAITTPGIRKLVEPDEGNLYNKLVLVNDGTTPMTSIQGSWTVVK